MRYPSFDRKKDRRSIIDPKLTKATKRRNRRKKGTGPRDYARYVVDNLESQDYVSAAKSYLRLVEGAASGSREWIDSLREATDAHLDHDFQDNLEGMDLMEVVRTTAVSECSAFIVLQNWLMSCDPDDMCGTLQVLLHYRQEVVNSLESGELKWWADGGNAQRAAVVVRWGIGAIEKNGYRKPREYLRSMLAESGISPLPGEPRSIKDALRESGLHCLLTKPQEFVLYGMFKCSPGKTCPISPKMLAQKPANRVGHYSARTIRGHVRELLEDGLIDKVGCRKHAGHRQNEYRLILPPVDDPNLMITLHKAVMRRAVKANNDELARASLDRFVLAIRRRDSGTVNREYLRSCREVEVHCHEN